ncbi:MAG: hypothetical protein KGO96_00375 [Elusimicrobia bacterium]|nr:hypothetical protein [Elusimicrobiota bacterium]MDE2236662.1 hypothetical protein [Elusimicrobiota bacterium]MDE2424349.1 hypothetical protein [Elusimicrobiota bacterium]
MVALLIGLLTSAGLLLRGGWDVWAQSFFFLAVACGTSLWLLWRVLVGYVPLPPRRLLAWAASLALLAGAASFASPVGTYAATAWRSLLLGLWIFVALAVVGKDQRLWIDRAIRAAAWVLALLAFYQHYHDGLARPSSALLNQNVFAGTILMLLALAAQQRDWLLAAALLTCLWWAHSVGAWLGLAAALVLTRRSSETVGNYVGMAVGFVCLLILYGKLQSPDVVHRWFWWKAAWRMSLARPLFGFGPGSYAYVAPCYFEPGHGLSSLYAHEHFLELAAENGWPYVFLWAAGLAHFLRRGSPHKRFAALAVLVQALWDYPLSIPANFWLFCYLAGSATPETSRGVNVSYERKWPWAVAVLAVGAGLSILAGRAWRADWLKARAVEGFEAGEPARMTLDRLDRSLRLAPDPEAERAFAEVLLAAKPAPSRSAVEQAALHLERSARLNPYRPSTWLALNRLYADLGEPGRGERLEHEGRLSCPALWAAAP